MNAYTSCGARARRLTSLFAVSTSAAVAPLNAQVLREGVVTVGRMDHRVNAGYGVAGSTGTVLGLGGRARAWQIVELEAHALGGRLQGDTVARADRKMGELGLRLNVLPMPWLAIGAAGTIRGYDAPLATQRWTLLGAGAEVRMTFAGGGVSSVIGTTLYPAVKISGQNDADLGISTLAGLQLSRGRLLTAVEYRLERYVFPLDVLGNKRHEQLAGLVIRLGGRL